MLSFAMAPPPGTTRREIELNFIRGVAILMVLIFHYRPHNLLITSPALNRIEGFGWTGVDVFFVLSGFLVGGLLMKEWQRTGSVDAPRFLKRRAFKIWPGYYAFLLVVTVIHVRPLAGFFWQNLFNIQNYIPSSLSHTWSLAVEEQFYLALAALLALWTARHWRPVTLLTICIALSLCVEALRAVLSMHHQPVYFYTHTRLDGLLLGVALAAVHTFWPEWFHKFQQQRVLLLTIVAIGLWRLYVDRDAYPEPDLLTSPFLITFVDYAAAALLLLLYRRKPSHTSVYRLVARIGIYSYGIYLWHVSVERPVNWTVSHVPHALTAVTSTLLPYLLAIPLGILATKFIEFPFLRLRQRLVPSRTPEPQIPDPQAAPKISVG
jgi:peptidoglycan/LPS O-acetylase OafA/YrhL